MKKNSAQLGLVMVILSLLVGLALTACSTAEPPGAETKPTSAPAAEKPTEAPKAEPTKAAATEEASATEEAPAATEEAAASQAKPDDYGLVWYASAPHPYFEEVLKGVDAFEKEYGIPVERQIGPDWEQASQNERVEALAAQGFKNFSMYPSDASGANGLYEELTAKGIKVINFGASTLEPTTASFVVATDVKAAAMQATEELIKAIGGKGNIINVLEVLEDSNTVLRKEGVEEVVAKYPDVKIIQEISGMKSTEEAVEKIGNAVSANIEEVDGLIATGFTTSVGIAQVLNEYYSTGGERKIHAVGIDTDPTVMKAIAEGTMDGTIAQNPYGHGYLSLLALKLMAEGYQPKPNSYRIDSGAVFVNKDNLETYTKDVMATTEKIKAELATKYLQKEGEAAATEEAAAAESEAKPDDYGLVWYASAPHPYFEEVLKGVDAFEKEYGIPVERQIGPDWEQASQNERVEALAAQGFKNFSMYPSDASGANGLYEELTAKGIKVINFGASTLEPTTASFVVATDVKAAAMQATEELIKAIGGKGNIINVLEVLEDSNTVLRKEGVEEVVAKYPDVKIIQEISGMKSTEEAVEKIGNAVSANIEEVDGLIATGFTTSVGIAQVLNEYYSTGGERKIHAVGIDTDPTVMKAIAEGTMDGTIAQNPYGHGYLSLLALKLMAEGYQPKPNSYRIDSGAVFVNKDNLETYTKDVMATTEKIKAELATKYLEK